MTRLWRFVFAVPAALVVLGSAGIAHAGGGSGGECMQAPPSMSVGWVAVLDFCFAPQTITVGTGDAVRWEVQGAAPHTVTFANGPDSGDLQGSEFAVQFNSPGSYRYSCSFHPGMTGTVNVEGEPAGGAGMEVIDPSGVGTPELAADPRPVAATRRELLIRFDALAAAVLLIVAFPLSAAGAFRLAGLTGRLARRPRTIRWRSPLYRRSEPRPGKTAR